jgi:acetylornithine deacetylase/succinyl-diaminopimelate desuccinylase-like protein
LHGPGICDDAAGLSLLLSLVRTFKHTGLRPNGNIWFVGTVGEEGLGDLRGVKHLFASRNNIDGFITIDGAGSNSVGFSALGSKRFEILFTGTGGHSYGAFDQVANPVHTMGRAIGAISDMALPSTPKTTCAVTVVDGGISINSIAATAMMQVDIRSPEKALIEDVVENVRQCVEQAVDTENRKMSPDGSQVNPVSWQERLLGDRPPGQGDPDAMHIQLACGATRALGLEPELRPPGSTDANVPVSRGIPALVLGRGGKEMHTHTLTEAFDPEGAYLAAQRAFLVIIAMTGIDGICGGSIEP